MTTIVHTCICCLEEVEFSEKRNCEACYVCKKDEKAYFENFVTNRCKTCEKVIFDSKEYFRLKDVIYTVILIMGLTKAIPFLIINFFNFTAYILYKLSRLIRIAKDMNIFINCGLLYCTVILLIYVYSNVRIPRIR
jgi:hypothetical protein